MRTLFLAFALAACDNSDAFHMPDPTLARMLEQRRVDAFERPMHEPPADTVPHDADETPPPITRELLALGRARFDRTCAACHGVLGDGDTVVAQKMMHRKPPSLHEARIRALSRADLVHVIVDGYGLMPSYASALTVKERWAVAAYVKALELSQRAEMR